MKTHINFLKAGKWACLFSAIGCTFLLLAIFIGGFNQGIDFSGGLTANLTINYEKSDIRMLRKLFADVPLVQKIGKGTEADRFKRAVEAQQQAVTATNAAVATNAAALKTGVAATNVAPVKAATDAPVLDKNTRLIRENLGTSISQLEAKDKKPYPHETYVIRFKYIDGVEKEQIENALNRILQASFTNKTVATLAVTSKDAADDGAALATLLKPFGLDKDIKGSTVTVRDGKATNVSKIFVLSREFAGTINETEFRNGITKALLNHPTYRLSEAVEFNSTIDWGSFNSVSSTIGQELEDSAIGLSIVCVLLILLYVAIRFDFKLGLGAIVALFHDMIVMIGFVALTDMEMTTQIVAAILTIFGFSINDTIVIFDRIRENLQFSRKEDLTGIVNRSVNQTLSRTIITSTTTMLATLAIYLFAGDVLRDFALALLIGMISGVYSTVFIASPVYLWLESVAEKRKIKQGKIARA